MKRYAVVVAAMLCLLVEIQNPDGVMNNDTFRPFSDVCTINPERGRIEPGPVAGFVYFRTDKDGQGINCPDGTIVRWDAHIRQEWEARKRLTDGRDERREQMRVLLNQD